jgi:hypothetical protein
LIGCSLVHQLKPHQSTLSGLFAGVILIFGIAMAWSAVAS